MRDPDHRSGEERPDENRPSDERPAGKPPPGNRPSGKRLGDLRLRIISSLVLLPAAAALISVGGPVFGLGIAGIAVLMAWEWGGLVVRPADRTRARIILVAASVVVVAVSIVFGPGPALIAAVGGVPLAVLVGALASVRRSYWLGLALAGTVFPAIALIWMRGLHPLGLETVLYVIATVVLVDIGAYVAGRTIGGPRLLPRVSPAKTWAGLLGGIGAAVCLAGIVAAVLGEARLAVLAPTAVAIALMAQAGDLLESAVKRHFNVKDSSHLIPGHGGILDRVDGQVTVLPAMALLMAISGRSVLQW